MSTININPPIKVGTVVVPPNEVTSQVELKGVTLDIACCYANNIVQQVLDAMQPLLQNQHKYISVFVKPMWTTIDKVTCAKEGWHFDAVENPAQYSNIKPELHHIWVGYSNDTTQFISTPMEIQLDSKDNLYQIRQVVEQQPYEIISIPKNTIVSYDRFNLHRGALCKESSYRLLVRVTESDIKFGSRKIGKELI